MGTSKYNQLILISLAVLTVGLALYYFDRSPTLLSSSLWGSSLWGSTPHTSNLFGPIGYNLPAFIHTLAFTLLTIGVGRLSYSGAQAAIVFWCLSDLLFELIQHPVIALELSLSFPNSEVSRFALYGTFDPLDMFAIALGTLSAVFILKKLNYPIRLNTSPH